MLQFRANCNEERVTTYRQVTQCRQPFEIRFSTDNEIAFTIAQPSSPMFRLPRCFAAAPVAGCAAPANRLGCCK
jgi:hypothetical protein